MNYYIFYNEKIVLFDTDKEQLKNTLTFTPQYQEAEILETEREIISLNGEFVFTDEHQEEIEQQERERLDAMTLTPADVERALYKAKGMDFNDLKEFILSYAPDINLKELGIEFRANNFYRGNPYISTVGKILGYSDEDLDYLFQTKEFPANNNREEENI